MNTYRKFGSSVAIVALIIAVAAAIIGIVVWIFAANIFIDGQIYPKSAQFLNLRGKAMTLEEYDALQKKLPNCDIYWDIPFQGKTYHENTMALTVTKLTDEDVDTIGYFKNLEVVNAMDCRDYDQILELKSRYPHLTVGFEVVINGITYPTDATEVTLTTITDEEIRWLQYLPQLQSVDSSQCQDFAQLERVMRAYPDLNYSVNLGGTVYTSDTTELTLTGITDAEAGFLGFFSNLTKLHLVDPVMDANALVALNQSFPNTSITWEVNVMGVKIRSDAQEVNLMAALSEAGVTAYEKATTVGIQGNRDETVWLFKINSKYPLEDMTDKTDQIIADVEAAMAYFPDVESVNLCGVFLDNEKMAAFRAAHRDEYKVIWTVECGKLIARSDTPYVMPYKYGISYFFDENTYNMRYLEDVVAVDLGHMSVHNCDFVEFMPNLKYLILAHTQIKDITPLQTCKNLLFLELDWGIVRDYTPLKGCTALEDLNLSKTFADIDPILEMTWLKHLWITDRGGETQELLRQTFEGTDTVLYLEGESTVSGGWRELQNYYDMRDALNMGYMKG